MQMERQVMGKTLQRPRTQDPRISFLVPISFICKARNTHFRNSCPQGFDLQLPNILKVGPSTYGSHTVLVSTTCFSHSVAGAQLGSVKTDGSGPSYNQWMSFGSGKGWVNLHCGQQLWSIWQCPRQDNGIIDHTVGYCYVFCICTEAIELSSSK